jgi:hypothetical protein
MEEVRLSTTSVDFQQTSLRYIPEDSTFHTRKLYMHPFPLHLYIIIIIIIIIIIGSSPVIITTAARFVNTSGGF